MQTASILPSMKPEYVLEIKDCHFAATDPENYRYNMSSSIGRISRILQVSPAIKNLCYDSLGSDNTTLIENAAMLCESNKQFDELTLIVTNFVKRRALEAILARLQAIVRTSATVFTYSPIDDSIRIWLLSFGMQLCGTAYLWKNNAATLMHMYKAVGPTGIEIMFGVSDPEEKVREMNAIPVKGQQLPNK
uniref:Uncharacterized protein n=1 Tax=Panagrolaimus sp. JU765 TaxID=591449 RepID=A0AC34QT95_9BILA